MMHRILYWLTSFMPCRLINDGSRAYLERYFICSVFGWQFYLHRFVGSDPDRGLHDHPWSKAYSIILSGWYFEETRCGTRRVRWLNSLTGDTFHRVVLPTRRALVEETEQGHRRQYAEGDLYDVPCWTLFFHKAGNVKPWGFWRDLCEPNYPDAAMFEPYTYTREGSQKEWWKKALTGREVRAAIAHRAAP